MEQIRSALRSLTKAVCRQLDGVELERRPVWTVVNPPDAAPHVAMDFSKPRFTNLRLFLNIGVRKLPEYVAAADAIQEDLEASKGIVIDDGGVLHQPDGIDGNVTRAVVVNFLCRYLCEGERLEWGEPRFLDTFKELEAAIARKSVVSHTTIPLSNLKVAVSGLDFGDELKLLPASMEELERWLNPDRSLPRVGAGPPQWNAQYLDRPGVLHASRVVAGQPPTTDPLEGLGAVPTIHADHAITALRIALNGPISGMFQEYETEGLIAFGGRSIRWGWSPPPYGPVAILDQEMAKQVTHVWQLLQTSPNTHLLKLPLRRWESSLLRTNLEDKLIDAWIGLEALLDIPIELSYRASLRLAEFLGTNGVERKTINTAVQDSYTWRSVIVHGSAIGKRVAKRQPLEEAVQLTTAYLRQALLKVLELPSQFEPKELEFRLLGREAGAP